MVAKCKAKNEQLLQKSFRLWTAQIKLLVSRKVNIYLYFSLPDRCGQKIHKSKGDRQCKIGQKENVCLFCSCVFSVRTGQADRGKNAPSERALSVMSGSPLISILHGLWYGWGARFEVFNSLPCLLLALLWLLAASGENFKPRLNRISDKFMLLTINFGFLSLNKI